MTIYLALPIVQAVSCFILASIVLRRDFTHYLFSMFLACLGIWGIIIFGMRASPNIEYAYIWDRFVIPLSPFMSVLFYHFSVRFTDLKINRWVLPVFYIACILMIPLAMTELIFSGMQLKSYGYAPVFGPVWPLWITLIYVLAVITLLNFIRARRRSTYAEQRNRLSYIIVGIAVSLLGGLFDALPVLGLPLYPGGVMATIVFCILTSVAIVKYRLMDISLVLRRGVAYFLTSIIVSAPVVASFFIIARSISQSDGTAWSYLLLVVIVMIALVFPLLWRVVQRIVNRWFFRDRYNYLQALETFSWHAQRLEDFTQLGDTTVNMIAGALSSQSVYLLQPLSRSGDFHVVSSTDDNTGITGPVLKADSSLLKWLQRSNSLLRCQEINFIPQLQNTIREEEKLLRKIEAELVVPLKTRTDRLSGLIIIGRKTKGQLYTIEDVQLMSSIGNQIAITLENIRLYEDIFEGRENLEKWLNGMSDCVIIINADRTVHFMNHAAEECFGYWGDKTCQDVLGMEECANCPIPAIFDDEGTHNKYTETRKIWGKEYEIAAAPLLNPDGTRSIIKVFRDITERKKLEEEIIQSKVRIETLRGSERLKTELLSMVSHELRTPLSVIKGNISALLGRKKWNEAEQRDFLRDIDQETDYLTRLVANLLDMSRLEVGAMQLDKDWYHISEILEWIEGALNTITKKHTIQVSIPSDFPLVYVDRVRIGQVLMNLCENAVKNSAEGSVITITGELSDNSIIISVSDTGKGIELEDLERIFDRFYRSGSKNNEEFGIGLGLSICSGIIETHGGRIWVQSQVGKGSKFGFELPLGDRNAVVIKPG
jgi:signal transduction histidine kinase